MTLPIVDSHLDLAENVTFHDRDLTITVKELRERENRADRQAMVTLPELERGGVAIVFGTVFAGVPEAQASPERKTRPGVYSTQQEAEANAIEQIQLYESWEQQGRIRLIKSVADIDHHLELWEDDRKPGLLMLMEGADPIVDPQDLSKWWARGLRMIGLTWDNTAYGTGVGAGNRDYKSGGLTDDGVALLQGMAEIGFIWDVSHLAEDAVREGLDIQSTRVCASHANARALVPTDRHLSDDIIREIARRDGVIGLTLCNSFLVADWKAEGAEPVTLEHVRLHAEHMAGIGGWNCVGVGSDLDGGFGLEETPQEINTIADLPKLSQIAPEQHRDDVLSSNWLRFLRSAMPASS